MICGRPLSHSCLMPLINTSHQHLDPANTNLHGWTASYDASPRRRGDYRQARKTGSWANYMYTQKECKRLFRQAEWNFVNNTIQEGLARNNSKPFWRYIKSKRQDNTAATANRKPTSYLNSSSLFSPKTALPLHHQMSLTPHIPLFLTLRSRDTACKELSVSPLTAVPQRILALFCKQQILWKARSILTKKDHILN